MTATREEIGARVDALAQAHEGDEFVSAVARLADGLGSKDRSTLQDILLERAADEEDFQKALRERARAKGWTRRTLERFEWRLKDDRADPVAEAIEAGQAGEAALAAETEALRHDRGRAAVVLDELSRHESARVRAWVPGIAVETLDADARPLTLALARDRDREVRNAALASLLELGPEAARPLVPDLRRRLHAQEAGERMAAMAALAAIGDRSALFVIQERAESAELAEERTAAQAAVRALEDGRA